MGRAVDRWRELDRVAARRWGPALGQTMSEVVEEGRGCSGWVRDGRQELSQFDHIAFFGTQMSAPDYVAA